jgi:hypothetical protein
MMEDRDVNEFLLTVFIEWVKKTVRGRLGRMKDLYLYTQASW